jgi:hypothetical protein
MSPALLLGTYLGSARPAIAEEVDRQYTLELNLFTGYNRLYLPRPSRRGEVSERDGGFAFGIGAMVRPKYFLKPFLDFHYNSLLRSTDQVDLGPALGGATLASNSLSTLGAIAGAGLDVWRIRVRGGIALAFVWVRSTVNGVKLSSTERDMGYFLGVGGYVWQSKRFKVGIEARTMLILNANIGFVSLGATASGDAVSW